MSFTDEYLALQKKKKKEEEETKQKTTGHSFTDDYNSKRQTKTEAQDIAPVYVNKTAALFKDFAPLKTTVNVTTDKDERKWFEKGAFEDGYQFGDVFKSTTDTFHDVSLGILQGIGNMAEGVVDLATYGVAGVSDLVGADKFAGKAKEFAKKDLVNSGAEWIRKDNSVYDDSILGEKSQGVTQGLGQVAGLILTGGLGASAGLGAAGTTALTTGLMGASSMGGGMSEAYNAGATDGEAVAYGAIKGAVDAGSELIFGGLGKTVNALGLSRGISSLDDIFARKLSSKISNQAVKNLVQYGVKASGEGLEEVLAGLGTAAAKKLTYMSDEELSRLVKDENLLEQFVVGTVVSGIAQGGDLALDTRAGRDFVTGMNANEETVVNKVYENRVAEAEKNGKITEKEKSKIYDQVITDMDKGYITTDTIEEVLGGETYKTHTDTIAREKALQDEYDTLYKMKNGEKSDEQIDRQAELKKQLDDIKQNFNRNQLGDEVMSLVNGSRLAESYNERSRRGQAFQADVSKYDAKQQTTIQKAIDSGILNNTNRTHEFVDMVAKITADKGVVFDFTNNENLKNSGFAVDGKTVNGYVTVDGVTLNIDSAKSLNSVVGHEITHVLEGTEMYTALQSVVTEYAKTKGEYQGRYDALAKLYEGVEGADVNAELTADLVGDYLFSDTDFVKHLSVSNRNVFQKIFDEIKYLCKIATAGSKEARELEKVKKLFEQAYRESGKAQTDTKYSIGEIVDENNNSYGIGVHLDSTLLDNLTPDERKVMVKERIKELGGEVFTAYDNNGNAVDITIAKSNAYYKTETGKKRPVNNDLTRKYIDNEVKQEAVVLIDELIATSEFQSTDPAKHSHGWLDNNGQNDWDLWTTYIQDKNNTIWEATLHIANTANGEKIIYDVVPTKKVGQSGKSDTSLLNNRVPQSGENVKHSLSDSDGKQLSKEQQEFFKDSKVRDENGNLLVMYHGTQKGGFTVFQNKRRPNTEGFYFTNDKKYSYTFEGRKANGQFYPSTKEGIEAGYYNPQRYKVYLDVKNPLVLTADQQDIIEDIGYWEHIYKPIKDAGYDGVMLEDMSQVFVFNSNQIKSTANAKPTADKDIRYSLSDSNGRDISPAVQKRFGNSKVVDEDGNLKAVFHGTATGEFSIFDKSKGSVEGDFGSGFYFTDNEADVSEHYEGGGPDFDNKVARLAAQIESEEEIDYEEAKQKAREQLYKGSHKFEVYLNIENPAIVGETMLFDPDNYFSQYNEEDYDSYEDYEADVEQLFSDDIENIIWDIERNVDIYSTDGIAEVMWEAMSEGGIGLEELKAKLNNLYLEDSEGNLVGNEVARQIIESLGFDGIIDPTVSGKWNMDIEEGTTHYIVFKPNQIKAVTNENPTDNPDIHRSLSNVGDTHDNHGLAPLNKFKYSQTYGKDIRLETAENVAPVQEATVAENTTVAEDLFPDDLAPVEQELDRLIQEQEALEAQLQEMVEGNDFSSEEWDSTNARWQEVVDRIAELETEAAETDAARVNSLDDADAPPERNVEYGEHGNQMTMPKSTVDMIAQNVKAALPVSDRQMGDVRRLIEEYGQQEFPSRERLFQELKDKFGTYTEKTVEDATQGVKSALRKYRLNVSDAIKSEIADYNDFRRRNFGKVLFSRQGMAVDAAYEELSNMYPGFFPKDIINPTDQLLQIVDVANRKGVSERTYDVDDDTIWGVVDDIAEAVSDYQYIKRERESGRIAQEAFDDLVKHGDEYAPVTTPVLNEPAKNTSTEVYETPTYDAQPRKGVAEGQQAMFEEPATEEATEEARKQTRKQLHQSIVDGVRTVFKTKGLDFDSVLKKAKNLSTFATVDNTPQRVMEKALGYKEGQILSDLTVNKVAQNETEGIKWLNSFTDRKNGLLRKISDQYHIKPGSKESAAAQMYAEGFYVAENNDIIAYGDAELAKDFPDPRVQKNIKGLARDPRIRQIYDETLDMLNESRTRNAYPEIQKLDNYFLHFRAMDDTFSKLGLPFNPNDIRAKDLPTDLNGVTADLKPGQPYFASAMHRTGKRTSFDLLGGLERYLTSAKNQIYHIDDIQTLRALRNYIADTYGQANGLEGLDALSEEEAQERIEKVYNSHLSTFAKFLNEEANILAGKTALIDRGLEGILGRRGMTFLDTVNKQVGSNMVGYNISSSLTNFLPVAQTFAKTNKFDFVRAFAQTVGNKVGSVFGRTDSFAESSPVIIRRKGADRFYRTPWQKLGDPGYALMGAVDDISTELIARTKFNELTRKGMDAQKAHYETDKWVSRLMGDRSLGQMPQIYNSKMLGLVTKFQLEVRNQLDSQFYDTIQETKVSAKHIENGLSRNAKIAAKVTSTFVQLAVVQHLFGKAFESVAGYNPAFDIISVLMTAFGYDDEEDSEDTALDNVEQAFLDLLEDLPYTSTFTGGRIPISSAMPISELVKGVDEWGNEKSRWETLGEIAPYYLLPGGYGQIKKTVQGLDMFSEDHPISGSYTGKGDLRFPVEDTPANRVQAAIFGQWASENARDYFDNNRAPLKEKQIQEFMDVDLPIRDYWEYREGLSGLSKLEEKADYIAGLDLPIDKKNLLINNLADREEDIDLTGYEDFSGFEEFDFAVNNPEQYEIAQKVGGYEAYKNYQEGMKGMKLAEKADYIAGLDLTTEQKNALINGETERKEPIDLTGYENYSSLEELDFATKYPENYAVAKAVGGYEAYKGYSDELNDIKADKDKYGKSISGSRKEKVRQYINNLDADYYTRIILWKSEYPSDDTYNNEIIKYLNGRNDISFEETIAILRKLGFDVTDKGDISW